jgi:hypothetical protein
MPPLDPILFRELPVIRKIVDDETWLEGERRGCAVSPHDPAVREKVCLVILRIGAQLRESLTRAEAAARPAESEPLPEVMRLGADRDTHAAA